MRARALLGNSNGLNRSVSLAPETAYANALANSENQLMNPMISGDPLASALPSGSKGMGFLDQMSPEQLAQIPQEMPPPPTFRSEYNGALDGMRSLLNILYAGVGLVSFGSTAFKTTAFVVKYLLKGTSYVFQFLMKSPGFIIRLLRNLIQKVMAASQQLDVAWGANAEGASGLLKHRKMLYFQIAALLGAAIAYFLKRRSDSILKQFHEQEELKALEAEEEKQKEETRQQILQEFGLKKTSEEFQWGSMGYTQPARTVSEYKAPAVPNDDSKSRRFKAWISGPMIADAGMQEMS